MAISPRIMAVVDRRCSVGTAMTTSDSSGMVPQLFSSATMDFTWAIVPDVIADDVWRYYILSSTITHVKCNAMRHPDLSQRQIIRRLTVAFPVSTNEFSCSASRCYPLRDVRRRFHFDEMTLLVVDKTSRPLNCWDMLNACLSMLWISKKWNLECDHTSMKEWQHYLILICPRIRIFIDRWSWIDRSMKSEKWKSEKMWILNLGLCIQNPDVVRHRMDGRTWWPWVTRHNKSQVSYRNIKYHFSWSTIWVSRRWSMKYHQVPPNSSGTVTTIGTILSIYKIVW